jgi:hypothetical protein
MARALPIESQEGAATRRPAGGGAEMATDEELREQAIKAIKRKRDFKAHLVAYVIVNAFLVAMWYLSTGAGYFWPGWIMGAWGIGLAFNAWDAYGRHNETPSDAEIQREMEKRR